MPPRSRTTKPAPERAFEAFRQRAANTVKKGGVPRPKDFVLGKDMGFDPEIRVKFPMTLDQQEAYYYASRNGDVFAQVRAVLGDAQYARVKAAFAGEPDSAELFLGFSQTLFDHVSGKGAGDVEGGSGRS
ncbi:hypothetical protein [Nocardia fusca]|uniref:Tail assembly chaperone n=1 Tax=Nocardia fusca TaxID=941183 RepID=A0ABV3FIK1_9NOCA